MLVALGRHDLIDWARKDSLCMPDKGLFSAMTRLQSANLSPMIRRPVAGTGDSILHTDVLIVSSGSPLATAQNEQLDINPSSEKATSRDLPHTAMAPNSQPYSLLIESSASQQDETLRTRPPSTTPDNLLKRKRSPSPISKCT